MIDIIDKGGIIDINMVNLDDISIDDIYAMIARTS